MEEGLKSGLGFGGVAPGKTAAAPASPPTKPASTAATATAAAPGAAAAAQSTSLRERLRHVKLRQKEEFIKFIGYLGRVGYASKGCAYGMIAGIAIFSVIQGSTASAESANLFGTLGSSPFGIFVLIAMIVGLMCYATWRLFEGIFLLRVRQNARLLRRIVSGRVVPFASCIFYCIFSVSLVIIIIDAGGGTGISTSIASSVGGQVCLILAGVILFAVALEQIIGAIRQKFMRDMNWKALKKNKHARRAVFCTGTLGIAGRALLFALLGVLFIRLAVDQTLITSSAHSGFAEAIGQFQTSVYGIILLIVVAVGLLVFMCFCWLQSRYKLFLNEGEGFESRRKRYKQKKLQKQQAAIAAGKKPLSLPPPPEVPAESA